MKDPFAPYIHLFLLFESFSFFAYTRIGPDPGRRFDTTKRGYVLSATRIFSRDRRSRHPTDSTDCVPNTIFFLPFFFYFFLFSPFLFLTSSLRAEWNTRSHNPIETFSLSSLLLSHASLLPYPPFFRLALNKYRFRLSELTPVSALYPLLTRIEFRTEDRFLFCRDLFGGSRDNVFPFFLLLFFKFPSNDAGRRDRKCVGVFAQKGTSTKLNRYH